MCFVLIYAYLLISSLESLLIFNKLNGTNKHFKITLKCDKHVNSILFAGELYPAQYHLWTRHNPRRKSHNL